MNVRFMQQRQLDISIIYSVKTVLPRRNRCNVTLLFQTVRNQPQVPFPQLLVNSQAVIILYPFSAQGSGQHNQFRE